MTAAQITAQVRNIVVDRLGVDEEDVKPDATLIEDLGCDSLDRVELALALEEEFGVEIPDDDISRMKTIRDIHEYLAVHAK
jgi:acyl carrier protein